MTEYDYSPDAMERHLAKQASIATWVERTKQHEPANPFIKLPDERVRQSSHHQQQQPQVHAQPTSHATPQRVVSPTYSSTHTSTSSTKNKSSSHRTSSHQPSSSRGLHPSSTSSALPYSRSPPPQNWSYFISPPTSPNGAPYLMPHAGQPPSLMQPVNVVQQHVYSLSAGSTVSGSIPAYYVPQVTVVPSQILPTLQSRSSSYSQSQSVSHQTDQSQSRSSSNLGQGGQVVQSPSFVAQVQSSQNPYGETYDPRSTLAIQPTPDKPVVVPINGGMGGYVVVASQGVTIVVSVIVEFFDGGVISFGCRSFPRPYFTGYVHLQSRCIFPSFSFSLSFPFRSSDKSLFFPVSAVPVPTRSTRVAFIGLGLGFRTRNWRVFLW